MMTAVKISGQLLEAVRTDLDRPHAFAYERVGFLLAGAARTPTGLILIVRDYLSIADEDYEFAPRVGAQIGSDAMRKAVQRAYRPASSLLHIHSHGHRGRPGFSRVDIESGSSFVPGFFQAVPRMPHGMIVLSDDAAAGRIWLSADNAAPIDRFVRVGLSVTNQWSAS